MDVEKIIDFIPQNKARLQAMFEAEKDRVKEEAGRAKEEIAAIRQILQETTLIQREQARILVRIEPQTERHKEELAADLAGAQHVTETKLQALIESLRHGANCSGAKP
jgi:hypothetical protein